MPGSSIATFNATGPNAIPIATPNPDANGNVVVLHANGILAAGVTVPVSAAQPMPVTGRVGVPPLVYSLSSTVAVGTTSGQLFNASALTQTAIITNTGSTNIWINPVAGQPAVIGSGICVFAGNVWTFGTAASPLPTGVVNAIATSTLNVGIAGG